MLPDPSLGGDASVFCVRVTRTSCSGWLTGSDFSITALMMLKIAVLAPMPSPSERIATTRERGRRAQRSQGVPQVADQDVEPGEQIALARVLRLQPDVAEPSARLAVRIGRPHPGSDEVVHTLGEMKSDLSVDVARDVVRAEMIAQS